jgi:hypothetical protein
VPVVLDFNNNNTIFHTSVVREETNVTLSSDMTAKLDMSGPEDYEDDDALVLVF